MKAMLYKRPNGQQEEIEVTNIYPEDEQWFIENQVKISMEELRTGEFAVYGDYGAEEEVMELDMGRSCHEVMKALRHRIEHAKSL